MPAGRVRASGGGFVGRGTLMQAGSPLLEARVVRVAPHVINTVLLASAIAVAALARMPPLAHPWLAAKLVARAVYIVVGSIALRRGRTRAARLAAFAAAVLAFAYIVCAALTRDPLSWLAPLG